MSYHTSIQWCHSTINPVPGCDGCPLWPGAEVFVAALAKAMANEPPFIAEAMARRLLRLIWDSVHSPRRRDQVQDFVYTSFRLLAPTVSSAVVASIAKELDLLLRCYAAHLNGRYGGFSKGYPASFDVPQLFPGRMLEATTWRPPSPTEQAIKPWLDTRARLIFVSDMGDALSESVPFEFLLDEIVVNAASPKGRQHFWLWLTKRPARMGEFYRWLWDRDTSWPRNLIPMTSILNAAYARQALHILQIPAVAHGLSIEPLDAPLTLPAELLAVKPWVIVGGESGHAAHRHPFHLAWARSIRDQCLAAGAPFFLKQLGGCPIDGDVPMRLRDGHGGEWHEWPVDLRVREMPNAFRVAA